MKKSYAVLKAWAVVIALLLISIFAWTSLSFSWRHSLPLIIFYLLLVFNTFFSIKLFASITPKDNKIQLFVDGVLFILYILISFSIPISEHFIFLMLLLFIVATLKYVCLLEVIDYPILLKRKMLADLIGVLACALTLGGIIFWNELYSTWIFTIFFAVANILLFTTWPLYRADRPQ